jgi:heat shock protein beta
MIKKLAEAKDDDEESESEYESSDENVAKEQKSEKSQEKSEEKSAEGDQEAQKAKKREEKIEKYNTFWKEFGKNIKLGIIEDASNRNKLAELTRWYSTHNTAKYTSFDEYIERMKQGQDSIYYIGGESRDSLLKYPTIQALLKKGYEVLLLDDPVDEFCMQHLNEYEKKKLVNVAKGDFKLPSDDETEKKILKKLKKMYEPLTDWWKNLLREQLDTVTISERLVDDPCVVVATGYGYSAYMEKIQKAQTYGQSNPMANSKKILEINPHHPVVKELLARVQDNAEDKETRDYATLLYEAALLNSGYSIPDAHDFSGRFFKIFNGAMGIPKDAKVEQVEVNIDDDEDETKTHHGEEVPLEDVKVEHHHDDHAHHHHDDHDHHHHGDHDHHHHHHQDGDL